MTDDAFKFPTSKEHPAQPGDVAASETSTLAETLNTAIDRAAETFEDVSGHLRDQTRRATDWAIGYTKDEPVKSLLVAAAVGAALVALIALLASSDD